MSFTNINYNEGSRELRRTGKIIYQFVEVCYGKDLEEKKVFNSGDFVKDWYDRVKFIITELGDSEHHTCSCSVDHFIMDGAPYDSAWLKMANRTAKLRYYYGAGLIEFFVPAGTRPTWAQLREMCGDVAVKS